MSYKAVDVAIVTRAPSHACKLVIICLARHYNEETGKCCPSYERMAEMMGLAKSSVARAVKEAIDAGLIEKRKARKVGTHEGPNHYRLLFYVQARLAEREAKRLGYRDVHVPMVRPETGTPSSPILSEEGGARPKRKRSQRRAIRTRMPEDWKPSAKQREKALEKGLPASEMDRVAEHFRLHWISKGDVKADWGAAWYIWVNNELKFTEADNERSRSPRVGAGRGNRGDDLASLHAAVQRASEERQRREGGGAEGSG